MAKVNDILRAKYVGIVKEQLIGLGEDVLVTGSNELALPVVDSEGNDSWIVVTIKVPTGSRDGDVYDGYAMQEEYQLKQAQKAEKARIAAEKKARKIELDEKRRAQKAAQKAAHAQV